MNNETTPGNVRANTRLGRVPERADLYDDVIVRLKFDRLTREEQFAQLDHIVAAERERWAQVAAVAVQELAGCATWTQGGVTCQALRGLLGKA